MFVMMFAVIAAKVSDIFQVINSKICTNGWLDDVWHERVQVPNMSDVKIRNCATPPPAKYIMEEVQLHLDENKIVSSNALTVTQPLNMVDRYGDNRWALGILSTMVSIVSVASVVNTWLDSQSID